MKIRRLFPLGKAYGEAFCNRTQETAELLGNIKSGKHTFLVAPRRYGKSSLCERVFEQLTFPHSKIDFHLAITDKDAERLIINGALDLISQSLGSASEKLMLIVKKYAKKLQPKLAMGPEQFKLELSLLNDSTPAENIAEALMILEKLLKEKDKQAVLLLDEFQEIGVIENGRGIEGAIRSIAQETQHLSIIFCGSNPHLLKAMFEDERRPLYKLCRKLVLDRISREHYEKHLNKAAEELWATPLPLPVFEKIIDLTELHPYYVNYLCDILCSSCEELPTIEDIEKAWERVVEEERSDLIKDFSALANNQRKLMIYIATHESSTIYSSETSKKTDMPSGSISRVISSLLEADFIEKVENQYRLITPVYKNILTEKG